LYAVIIQKGKIIGYSAQYFNTNIQTKLSDISKCQQADVILALFSK